MEIPHLASAHEGPPHGVLRAARRAVVPRNQQRGPVDQAVVAHGIAAAVVAAGKGHRLVRRRDDPSEAQLLGCRKAQLLPRKRNDGHEPQLRALGAACQHGLGRRKVEARRHARKEGPHSPRVELSHRVAQQRIRLAAVGPVARKRNRGMELSDHSVKDSALARTLQVLRYIQKSSSV